VLAEVKMELGEFSVNSALLLVGSSGFLGSHILGDARLSGLQAVGMSRSISDSRDISLDLSKPDWLYRALSQFDVRDVVFALGGRSTSGPPTLSRSDWLDFQAGIEIARAPLKDARRVIFFGSAAEYGPSNEPHSENAARKPTDSYGKAKVAESDFMLSLKKDGVPITVVRPTSVYGPGQTGSMFIPSAVRALKSGAEMEILSPNAVRDYLHVTDLTRAVLKILKFDSPLPSEINLSSGFTSSIEDIARMISELTGSKLSQLKIRPNREECGSSDVVLLNSDLAQGMLNWRARISILEGLESLVRCRESC
jgi:UDP-glucose 4-epimerase